VTPFIATAPPVGCSSRAKHRSKVVLPEPDGPITQTTSFGATAKQTRRSTSVGPKLLDTASAAINGTAKPQPLLRHHKKRLCHLLQKQASLLKLEHWKAKWQ
jgi:hypothetical protein